MLDRSTETLWLAARWSRTVARFKLQSAGLASILRALVPLCVAFPALAAPNWSTLNRSIVKVEVARKPDSDTGVGIVIAASSDSIRILTAAHVVADATAWRVYFYSDQAVAYIATVLPRSSDGLDLAVLEVRPQGRPLPGNLPRLAAGTRWRWTNVSGPSTANGYTSPTR
jgi:hypothetical protein